MLMEKEQVLADPLASGQGIDSTIVVYADKIVVKNRGMGGVLRRAISTLTDPMSIVEAIQGPSKEILLRALVDSTDLAHAILRSVYQNSGQARQAAPESDPSGVVDQLREALEKNRTAFLEALRENQGLLKDWAAEHKDLVGIFLRGDVHVAVDTVYSVELTSRRDFAGVLKLEFAREQVAVPFQGGQHDDFQRVKGVIDEMVGGPAAPTAPEPVDPEPVAGTKTCPMCAEEVKLAAKICRFCRYTFE